MKTRNLIFLAFIAAISGYILRTVTHVCESQIANTDTVYIHSVTYDTIIQEKPVPVLKYVPVDTAYIIAQYFSVKYYDDILKDDSTGYIRLKEKVYKSEILDRELYFESRCENTIITNTIKPSGLYGVASIGATRDIISPSVGVLYLTPQERLYGLKIGYLNNLYFELSYGVKF